MNLLEIQKLYYSYDGGKTPVLKDLNFTFDKGMTYSIVGKSGAGKTTLLSLLSGLDTPTDGKILFNGTDVSKMDREKFRSKNIGVVFQSFNLLPHLTALENVILSIDISGKKVKNKKELALESLAKVELNEEKANRRILKLSGGEQQRVAIARVLSYNPDIILADEPTGNLDHETETQVMRILTDLAKKEDKCVIIVTHSQGISKQTDVVYNLQVIKKQ